MIRRQKGPFQGEIESMIGIPEAQLGELTVEVYTGSVDCRLSRYDRRGYAIVPGEDDFRE